MQAHAARRRRIRTGLAVAASVIVVAGGATALTLARGADRAGAPAGSSACAGNLSTATLPTWARAGFSAARPSAPHVLGTNGDIVAHPLRRTARPPAGGDEQQDPLGREGRSGHPAHQRATPGLGDDSEPDRPPGAVHRRPPVSRVLAADPDLARAHRHRRPAVPVAGRARSSADVDALGRAGKEAESQHAVIGQYPPAFGVVHDTGRDHRPGTVDVAQSQVEVGRPARRRPGARPARPGCRSGCQASSWQVDRRTAPSGPSTRLFQLDDVNPADPARCMTRDVAVASRRAWPVSAPSPSP